MISWSEMADPVGWGLVEEGWRKGPWTAEEDKLLIEYVKLHGEGRWNSVSRLAGLKRNGKSCRLRWVNYLRPDLKRGQITHHEERIILELHARWGNRWSTIARSLPGRTDNEIKNYWRTHFKKKTKNSTENSEKSKAKLLRKQQFQLQQQQQQQIQMQMQQAQIRDMKKLMSLLDENEDKIVPYLKQDAGTAGAGGGGGGILSNMADDNDDDQQQGFMYSTINNINYATVPEVTNEDIFWDGLWNMDDLNFNFNYSTIAAVANRAAATLQTPAATAFY